jgi:hypothetical protein
MFTETEHFHKHLDLIQIAQSIQRRATRPGTDSRYRKEFSSHRSVQTDSGAQPVSCLLVTVGSFLEVKRPGSEADQ